MEARLQAALAERDHALLELGRSREQINAARMSEQWQNEQEIPLYPIEAGAALPVPLRYRLVDVLSRWADRLPGVKRRLRAWIEKGHGA